MANNEYINKVLFGDTTVMDISDTTAEEGDVIEGQTFYTKSGAPATGSLGDATTSTHGLMSVSDKIKLDNIDKNQIYKIIDTPANVMGFSDGADDLPMALTVWIDPVQDLHGYANPWPAGGGKNKANGVERGTHTSINENSANNGRLRSIIRYIPVIPGSKYTFSATSNRSGKTLQVAISSWASDDGSERNGTTGWQNIPYTYTAGNNDNYVRFLLRFSDDAEIFIVDVTNIQFEAGNTATAYAPYSNICPISGWTGCNVTRTGKNLFDKTATTAGVYINEDGTIGESSAWRISDYMPVVAGGQISYKGLTNRGTNPRAAFYDENKAFISSFRPSLADYYTMDVPAGVRFVRFSVADAASHYDKNTFMMVEGNDIGDYEAYNSTTFQISFPSTPGTVYGGTLTVNKDGTGTLVVDQKKVVLNGSEDWRSTTNAFYAAITGDYLKESTANGACDSYDFIGGISGASGLTKNSTIGMFTGSSYNRIYIRDDQYGIDTDAFKSALASKNVTVCYELATAQPYQLSELEVIETLKGINNIYADTGSISYINYFTNNFTDIDEYIKTQNNSNIATLSETQAMIDDYYGGGN